MVCYRTKYSSLVIYVSMHGPQRGPQRGPQTGPQRRPPDWSLRQALPPGLLSLSLSRRQYIDGESVEHMVLPIAAKTST